MIDVFMLVLTIVLGILLVLANVYLLAYYCHPDDRGFGSALICKIVVVNYTCYIGSSNDTGVGTSAYVTFRCFQ